MSRKKYKSDSTEKAIEIIKAILTLCLVYFSYFIIQGFVGWIEDSVSGTMSLSGMIIAVYLFVPIVEEMVFRGKGYKALEDSCGTAVAVILSSLLFAIAHGNILQGIYAFAAGLVFSFIIAKSGSLITGILAHAGFNISGPLLQATLGDVEGKYLTIGAVAVVIVTLVGIVAAGGISDNDEQEDNDDEFTEYKSLD